MLVLGLGNPEEKYQFTRHNVGFLVLDAIAAHFQFPSFLPAGGLPQGDNFQSKLNAQISKGKIGNQSVILAKPQTLMNESGIAAKLLIKNYKLPARHASRALRGVAGRKTKNLVVVHDDIDLPLGRIKISVGSGSAGHKGVESVIEALGTKDFIRLRIGIQPKQGKPKHVEEFVLKRFSLVEKPIVKQTIQNACAALDSILTNGVDQAMQEYN